MCLAVQRDTQEFDALQNVLLAFVIVLQKITQTALAQQRHALLQLSGHVFQDQLLGRPLVQHGHHFGDHRVQFVNVDGFEDIVYGFHLQSITQISHICIAADKYDFDAGIALQHIFGQCDAVHMGHPHVCDDDVNFIPADKIQRWDAVVEYPGHFHTVLAPVKVRYKPTANRFLIVCDNGFVHLYRSLPRFCRALKVFAGILRSTGWPSPGRPLLFYRHRP